MNCIHFCGALEHAKNLVWVFSFILKEDLKETKLNDTKLTSHQSPKKQPFFRAYTMCQILNLGPKIQFVENSKTRQNCASKIPTITQNVAFVVICQCKIQMEFLDRDWSLSIVCKTCRDR